MASKFYKQKINTFFQYVFMLFILSGNLLNINAQTCTPDIFGNYFCSDFNENATKNIDERLNLRHNANVNKKLFTTRDNKNSVYVRNPDCWIGGLNFTAHCVYSSSGQDMSTWGGQMGDGSPATLITPRHCLSVAHAAPTVGSKIRFVTNDNVMFERTVQAVTINTDYSTYFPDICVVLLNQDLPSSISVAKFLPANYKNYLPNSGKGLPILHTDWERKALVANVGTLAQASDNLFYIEKPAATTPNRTSFYEGTWGGDSGSPYYLIMNGETVLIGLVTGYYDSATNAPYGTSQAIYGNTPSGLALPNTSINDLIKKVDGAAAINTGYQISFFDFKATSAIAKTPESKDVVFVSNRMLNIHTDEYSEIDVTDVYGRQIFHFSNSTSNVSHKLSNSGLYLVTITKGNQKKVFKLLAF